MNTKFKKIFSTFIKRCLNLKDKLGLILIQLPHKFSYSEKNINKLIQFGEFIKDKYNRIRCAFEFRNVLMFNNHIYELLKSYNFIIVANDNHTIGHKLAPSLNKYILVSKNICIRLRGTKNIYKGKYSILELNNLVNFIKNHILCLNHLII